MVTDPGRLVPGVGSSGLEADSTQELRSGRKAEYHGHRLIKVYHQVVTPTTVICKVISNL